MVVGISRIVGCWGGRFGVDMELVGQGLFVEKGEGRFDCNAIRARFGFNFL